MFILPKFTLWMVSQLIGCPRKSSSLLILTWGNSQSGCSLVVSAGRTLFVKLFHLMNVAFLLQKWLTELLLSALFKIQSINIWIVKTWTFDPQKYHICFRVILYITHQTDYKWGWHRESHLKSHWTPSQTLTHSHSHQDSCGGGTYIMTGAKCSVGPSPSITHGTFRGTLPAHGAQYGSFRKHFIIDTLLNGY